MVVFSFDRAGWEEEQLTTLLPALVGCVLGYWEWGEVGSLGSRAPVAVLSDSRPAALSNACPLSGPQVLHLYCDTCSVPICRECTMGRHGGHSFIYLQEALQDSRALTIQLLADAQQGRQAIQVSPSPHPSPTSLCIKPSPLPFRWRV